MMVRFLVFFLFISCAQPISTSDFHKGLNHSSGQTHRLLERLYGSIKHKTRLDGKVEERKNEQNYELSDTEGRAQRGKGAVYGGANINRRPRRSRNSAPSLLTGPHFWVPKLIPFVGFAFTVLFPFH